MFSGRFRDRFSSFFQAMLRESRDSQRTGPNLDFDRQARYFGRFAHFAQNLKIDKYRRQTDSKTVRERGAQRKRAFSASGGTSESILVAPRRSQALPGTLSGASGRP